MSSGRHISMHNEPWVDIGLSKDVTYSTFTFSLCIFSQLYLLNIPNYHISAFHHAWVLPWTTVLYAEPGKVRHGSQSREVSALEWARDLSRKTKALRERPGALLVWERTQKPQKGWEKDHIKFSIQMQQNEQRKGIPLINLFCFRGNSVRGNRDKDHPTW